MPEKENEQLLHILQLAEHARQAEKSALWKTDADAAIEEYADTIDRMHAAIYALLDERRAGGAPVKRLPTPVDPVKEIKKQIVARIKQELPALVASALDDL